MKQNRHLRLFFLACLSVLLALIDRTPLLLDARLGTDYIEKGFYLTYNGILDLTMEAPYPYRFLAPQCIGLFSWITGMTPIGIAYYFNIACIFLTLVLFERYARHFLNPFESFVVTLALALYLSLVQSQFMGIIVVESQDIANAVFFIALLLLGFGRKWPWFGILLAVSMTNRETPLILLVPFGWLLLREKNYGQFAWISAAGIIPYIAIRVLMPVKQGNYPDFTNRFTNFPFYRETLDKALDFNLHFLMFVAPVLVLAFLGLKSQELLTKLLVLTAIPFLIVHYIMGSIIELRLFLPLIIVLLPIAMKNLKLRLES